MPLITLTTIINAPIQVCFDLARNIDAHVQSTTDTKEKAIAGITSGLIEEGQTVTWLATHFGIRQKLTVKITKMNKYSYFRDEMQKGAFKTMWHEHFFESSSNGTLMTDKFYFEAPFGLPGKLANMLFLKKYMTAFLAERNRLLKQMAETQA